MNKSEESAQANMGRRALFKTAGIGALAGGIGLLASHEAVAQPQSYSYWTHGNAVRVQFPERLSRTSYEATSAAIFGIAGTENWFHIPFTNPVFIVDQRPQILDAIVLLNASENVFLREARLFDGKTERGFSQDLEATGEITQRIEISDPTVFLGLGISFRVEFTEAAVNAKLEIIGAGLDLIIP
jgi:hypothetical protein